jgi:GTP-binding nuclear protein Ran
MFSAFSKPREIPYKIVLIGGGGVGKTSFSERLSKGDTDEYKFKKKYEPTIGGSVVELKYKSNIGDINMHLWDTAGQEKFGELRDAYVYGSDAIILMYNLNDPKSIRGINKWLRYARRVCPNVPIAICGNQKDKVKNPRSPINISWDSKSKKFLVSAKEDDGIRDPFVWIFEELILKAGIFSYGSIKFKNEVKKPTYVSDF